MAKNEKKRCKECDGMGSECKCPKKGKGGYFNDLENDYNHSTMDYDSSDFGVSEGIKMPKAPSDADRNMRDMSSEKRKKTLDAFQSAADDAKKRQKYKDENDKLRSTTINKGVRFYDKKGSGYLKGGKKTYD